MGWQHQNGSHAGPSLFRSRCNWVTFLVQLAFNPVKPHLLYASFRRRDKICGWDLRGNTVAPLQTFRCGDGTRPDTNQKMHFDIDLGGKLMGVGDQVSVRDSLGHLIIGDSCGIER
jgi:hypothetical protein